MTDSLAAEKRRETPDTLLLCFLLSLFYRSRPTLSS